MPFLLAKARRHQHPDRLTGSGRLPRLERDRRQVHAQVLHRRLLRGAPQLQQPAAEGAALHQEPVSFGEKAAIPTPPARQRRDRAGIVAVERGDQRHAQPPPQPEQVHRLGAEVRVQEEGGGWELGVGSWGRCPFGTVFAFPQLPTPNSQPPPYRPLERPASACAGTASRSAAPGHTGRGTPDAASPGR